jgi:acetyl-CoA carboxylase carboxyl transferase subunit alpha
MGGAHRAPEEMMQNLRKALAEELAAAEKKPLDKLLEQRYQRLMSYGEFKTESK